jgi:CheY-like chemotaxis protein
MIPAVDLAFCAADPIRVPGAIQPYDALLVLDLATLAIRHVSANLAPAPAFHWRPAVFCTRPRAAPISSPRQDAGSTATTRFVNRRQFVAGLGEGACDIVLADYPPPDFDGLSTLNISRALQPKIPFIFVSSVAGEEFATNAPKRGRAILIVDDDSNVRDVVATMLEDLGCCVIAAASGGAALDIFRSNREVDPLLVDYAMPGMNGAETVRAATEIRPDLPAIFVTFYADSKALDEVGEDRLVRQPFRSQEVADKIQSVLPDAEISPDAQISNIVRLRQSTALRMS